jgi:hypothetical protein
VVEIARQLRGTLPSVEDVLGVAGSASLVYGVHLVHVPAAFIVAGVMLLAASIFYARGK